MKVIYESKKPRYHVQRQNPADEWEYWRGYSTATEAIAEADRMAELSIDNYRVIDSLGINTMTTPICPECRDGKPKNCTGWAIDDNDQIVECETEK